MKGVLAAFGAGLMFTFLACCLASAALQIVAWTRHARPGVGPTLRGFREPEKFFDATGAYQVRLARRLLLVGGVAYLSLGVLMLLGKVVR